MRKLSYLSVFILCLALLFTGCDLFDPLPEEYVDGVRVPRDYPDNDFEIYDDAIVYEVEEEKDEEIVLKYGTEDEMDDVIDFYKDLFEDVPLAVNEQEDNKDEFYAEGYGDGFKFEVTVEEPSGDYEERAFATVVEVYIELLEVGELTLEKLQGFWLLCGQDGEILDNFKVSGYGANFVEDKANFYADFVEDGVNLDYAFTDNDTIKYIEDGEENTVDIAFETIDGIDILTLTNKGIALNFEKSSYDEMMSYQNKSLEEALSNLQGFWHYCGDEGVLSDESRMDGVAFEFNDMNIYLYSEFSDDPIEGSFSLIDENTIDYVSEGESLVIEFVFETIDGINILSMTVEGETVNFEKSSFDEMLVYQDMAGEEGEIVLLNEELTDSALEYWLSDVSWEFYGYVYPDESFEEAGVYEMIALYSDYSGYLDTDDSQNEFSWYVEDSYLILNYTNGESAYWPVDFEYDGSNAYTYLFDLQEGFEGGFWVYIPQQ